MFGLDFEGKYQSIKSNMGSYGKLLQYIQQGIGGEKKERKHWLDVYRHVLIFRLKKKQKNV